MKCHFPTLVLRERSPLLTDSDRSVTHTNTCQINAKQHLKRKKEKPDLKHKFIKCNSDNSS